MTSSRGLVVSLSLLGLLAGFVPTVLEHVPALFMEGNQPPAWFPMLGSPGEMVTYSLLAAGVLGFLLSPVGSFLVGYWTSDAVAVGSEGRLVLALYVVLGVVGVGLGAGLAVLAVYSVLGYYPRAITTPVSLVVDKGGRGVVFALAAFAGAAVAASDRE